jgi:hypothetical protein
MILRVTFWLLIAAILLSAVPWELSAHGSPMLLASMGSTQAPTISSGSPESVDTSIPIDCVCLCLSGSSTPALPLDTLTTSGGSQDCPIATQPVPPSAPFGSVFHPPQLV